MEGTGITAMTIPWEHWKSRILDAELRIRPHLPETPLARARSLGGSVPVDVHLKLENRQETGSFKLRGAANKLLSLTPEQAGRGVVTASNGNHALAVAAMGRRLRIPTEVFVSRAVDASRRRRIEDAGATVRQVPGGCLDAEQTARAEGKRSGRVYVSPYNDAAVMAGQGTIAAELLRQMPRLDAVFVAVGGGGLIGGIGALLKAVSPSTEVVGGWPVHSPVLYECLRAGRIIDVPERPTLSVSTAGGLEPDSITFDVVRDVIDRRVRVSEEEILEALRRLYREENLLVEGAAGVAAAAFLQVAPAYAGKSVAVILCGGNAGPELTEMITAS